MVNSDIDVLQDFCEYLFTVRAWRSTHILKTVVYEPRDAGG